MKSGMIFGTMLTVATVVYAHAVHAEDQSGVPVKHHYLLSINLAPAACVLHPENRELRQCQEGYALIVHGLWTEKATNPKTESCSEKPPELSPVQQRVLEKLMPDEEMRNNAWQKYGACMGLSAQEYFRAITAYTNKLKLPGIFREEGNDRQIGRDELVAEIQRLNGNLPEKALYLRCQSKQDKTFLTEVRVCYDKEGQFAECKNFKPNCPESMTLRAIK